MKILFVHLLDNYTGSPKVMAGVIRGLRNYGYSLHVLTSPTEGFISIVKVDRRISNGYFWANNKFLRFFLYAYSCVVQFFYILLFGNKYDLIYINTLLPFSAALAAKLLNKKIIYHVHEVFLTKGFFGKFLLLIMKKTSTNCISVSNYVAENLPVLSKTVYNFVPKEFVTTASVFKTEKNYLQSKFVGKQIILIASLRKYKGIDVFYKLATILKDFEFILITSSTELELSTYFNDYSKLSNLLCLPMKTSLEEYYKKASIVVNLSLPNLCVETFGLTILEGLTFGCPCIVPAYGGPLEIIDNNIDGFLIDPYNIDMIVEKINKIFESEGNYYRFALNAFLKSTVFSEDISISKIDAILHST